MRFSLDIEIDHPELLEGQSVTIVRSLPSFVAARLRTGSRPSAGPPMVAWLALKPRNSIKLAWDHEPVGLYMVTALPAWSEAITPESWNRGDVLPGDRWSFDGTAFTHTTTGGDDQYVVVNDDSEPAYLGLRAAVTVNGNDVPRGPSPFAVAHVLAGQEAMFDSGDSARITIFVSSTGADGSVIGHVPSDPVITFSAADPCVKVAFNDRSNVFYRVSDSARAGGV